MIRNLNARLIEVRLIIMAHHMVVRIVRIASFIALILIAIMASSSRASSQSDNPASFFPQGVQSFLDSLIRDYENQLSAEHSNSSHELSTLLDQAASALDSGDWIAERRARERAIIHAPKVASLWLALAQAWTRLESFNEFWRSCSLPRCRTG